MMEDGHATVSIACVVCPRRRAENAYIVLV